MANIEDQQGGSAASDYVMALMDKPCTNTFPLQEKVNFSVQEIVRNYGSVYKTTGGGKRQIGGFGMDSVSSFVKKLVDNRILDLYLKFLGITLLTPATLVPIALIMGKETFEQVVKDMKQNDKIVQNGGEGFLDVRIPIIDSDLIGSGLKLAGLTALNVSPYTLVPLGVLMYIYDQYNSEEVIEEVAPIVSNELAGGRSRKQKGSGIATVLPAEYFGRKSCSLRQRGGFPNNNLDTPALRNEVFGHRGAVVDNSGIDRPYQNGGRRRQNGGFPNNNLDTPALRNEVFGHRGTVVDNSGIDRPYQNGGTRNIFGNDIPPNMVQNAESLWTGQDVDFSKGSVYNNSSMQLSSHIPSQQTYNPPYSEAFAQSSSCAGISKSMAGGKRRSRKSKQYAGASSDWIGTLYSRGPVNTIDMDPAQLRMFNTSSSSIPNNVLAGGPLPSATFYNYGSYANSIGNYKPLYLENIVSQPANSGERGVFAKDFNF